MTEPCPRLPEVEAEPAGPWPSELAAHVASCERCRDAALVARSLRHIARVEAGAVPAAGLVFRRLQARGRLEADRARAERALRPLRIAEVAAGVLVVAAAFASSRWSVAHPGAAFAVGTMVFIPIALAAGAFLAARR
jgi:hypothetical protein